MKQLFIRVTAPSLGREGNSSGGKTRKQHREGENTVEMTATEEAVGGALWLNALLEACEHGKGLCLAWGGVDGDLFDASVVGGSMEAPVQEEAVLRCHWDRIT